jgi:hypothetical protein
MASVEGHIHVINRLLLDSRIDHVVGYYQVYQVLIQKGDLDMIKCLVKEYKIELSGLNSFAIIVASRHGHLDVVDYLLKDEKIDPATSNNSAIRSGLRERTVTSTSLNDF